MERIEPSLVAPDSRHPATYRPGDEVKYNILLTEDIRENLGGYVSFALQGAAAAAQDDETTTLLLMPNGQVPPRSLRVAAYIPSNLRPGRYAVEYIQLSLGSDSKRFDPPPGSPEFVVIGDAGFQFPGVVSINPV